MALPESGLSTLLAGAFALFAAALALCEPVVLPLPLAVAMPPCAARIAACTLPAMPGIAWGLAGGFFSLRASRMGLKPAPAAASPGGVTLTVPSAAVSGFFSAAGAAGLPAAGGVAGDLPGGCAAGAEVGGAETGLVIDGVPEGVAAVAGVAAGVGVVVAAAGACESALTL